MKIKHHCTKGKADLPTMKSVKPEHLLNAMRVEQRGRTERSEVPNGRPVVRGSTPGNFRKTKIANVSIRVILELYL